MPIPDVTGLQRDEIRNSEGRICMRRYYLKRSRQGDIRYHEILESDTDRHLHDRPWDFTSVILDGTYLETTPTSETVYEQGNTIHRKAASPHRLTLTNGPVWTRVSTGPYVKTWGFYTPEGWIDWRQYRTADHAANA